MCNGCKSTAEPKQQACLCKLASSTFEKWHDVPAACAQSQRELQRGTLDAGRRH